MPNTATTGARILAPTTVVHQPQAHRFTDQPFTSPPWLVYPQQMTPPQLLPSMQPQTNWSQLSSCVPLPLYPQSNTPRPQLLSHPPTYQQPSTIHPHFLSLPPWPPFSQPQGTHHQVGFSHWIQPQGLLVSYPRSPLMHHQLAQPQWPVCSQPQPSGMLPLTNQDDNVQGTNQTFRSMVQVPQPYQNVRLKPPSPARQQPHENNLVGSARQPQDEHLGSRSAHPARQLPCENPGLNLLISSRQRPDENLWSKPVASARQQQDIHLRSNPTSPARQLPHDNPARQQPCENLGSKVASRRQQQDIHLGSKTASPVKQLPHENPELNLVALAGQQPYHNLGPKPVASARQHQDVHLGSKPVSPAGQLPSCEYSGLNLEASAGQQISENEGPKPAGSAREKSDENLGLKPVAPVQQQPGGDLPNAPAGQHPNENLVKQEPEKQDTKLKLEPKLEFEEAYVTPKRECKEDLDGVEGKLMVAQKAMAIQREHLEDLQDQLRWCREKLQAALKHAEELEKENDELKQQCQNSSEPSTSAVGKKRKWECSEPDGDSKRPKHLDEVADRLQKNHVNVIKLLDMSVLRPYLHQDRVITDQEYNTLLEVRTEPHRTQAELFLQMLKSKGTCGNHMFLAALEKTASEHLGHEDIISLLHGTAITNVHA